MRRFLLAGLALITSISAVADDRDEAKQSAAAERTAKKMRTRIVAEVKRLGDHQWAGDYYAGDGMGVNTSLAMAPSSGFVFEWHGCLGLYDRNYGPVALTNGRVRLQFTFENERKGFQGIAPELIPVSWGPRHYLVPVDDVVGFCNKVNEGTEPREGGRGSYFLRKGDEKKKVTGLPKVPGEYRPYLVGKPIEATIVAVGQYTTRPSVVEWKFKDTPVTLDAGANKGLRIGMELLVTEPRDIVESVEITKMEEDHSEGTMTQIGEEASGPKRGWRLSTQAPWRTGR